MTGDTSAVLAAGQAFKQVGRVNRAGISLRAGVVAAVPVAGMLALGTVVGTPTTAVILGAGAMLSGVAWRSGDAPLVPPIGTMLVAAAMLAAATLAGTLTGRWQLIHLGVLVLVCLAAGSATVLGRSGNVVGTQMVIAFVVFGRFPEDFGSALAGAGLVLAGGIAQTLFAFVVAFPRASRRQRDAVATAYRELAVMTGSSPASGPATARALDQADAVLSAPALFAHPRRTALSDLVDEGRRIRLELLALNATVLHELDGENRSPELDAASRRVGGAITRIASTAAGEQDTVIRLPSFAAEFGGWASTRESLDSFRVEERLAALTGQVNAAIRLALALEHEPDRRGWEGVADTLGTVRPTLGYRSLRRRVLSDLSRIRESATLQSAAGRHAIRLAVVVAGTELLAQRLALPRGYWAVVAAATILRPEFGATFTRGGERVLGTCVGVVFATLIAVAIDPSGWGIVVVVGVLSVLTYAVFAASFTAGIAGLTGVVVFLLHAVAPGTVHTALDRGVDTIVGGVLGLVAYALWPTWSSMSTGRLLSALVTAQRQYLERISEALTDGGPIDDPVIRPLARAARLAWTDAQAAVELARSEPRRGALDPRRAAATLGALRRVVWAVHGLRLRAAELPDRPPLPELSPLLRAIDDSLVVLGGAVREGDGEGLSLPPLRTLHRELAWPADAIQGQGLLASLDELVDAVDTAAVSVGIGLP